MFTPRQISLFAVVALTALLAANAEPAQKLFGTIGKKVAKVDADVYDESQAKDAAPAAVDDYENAEERHPPTTTTTTPRPGFFHQFTLPTFSFPALPALPALPPFPSIPPLPELPNLATILPRPNRPTIVATQTLYVEVTRRVTRVPVCMTVVGVRPPCVSPHHDHGHQYGRNVDSSYHSEDDNDSLYINEHQEPNNFYIQPTAAYRYPGVSATLAPAQPIDSDYESRQAKYLELKKAKGKAAEKENEADALELESSSIVEPNTLLGAAVVPLPLPVPLPLGHAPIVVTVSKTLHVTRVQTVTDYRATATLIAHNCIPSGVNIPFCRAPESPILQYDPPREYTTTTHRPTTRRTRPTTRYTTPYPTTSYPTTRYPTTQYSTTQYPTTKRPTTPSPIHPYGSADHYYVPDAAPQPPSYVPAAPQPPSYAPAAPQQYNPYQSDSVKEIEEQVDAAEQVDDVLEDENIAY